VTPKERSRDEWRKKLADRDRPRRSSVGIGSGIAAAAEDAERAQGNSGGVGSVNAGSPSAADLIPTPPNTIAGGNDKGFFGGSRIAGASRLGGAGSAAVASGSSPSREGGPVRAKRSASDNGTPAASGDVDLFKAKMRGTSSITGLAGGIMMLRRRAQRRIERRKRRHSIASDVQAGALVSIPGNVLGAIARM